jgi:hypothetical protein
VEEVEEDACGGVGEQVSGERSERKKKKKEKEIIDIQPTSWRNCLSS